MIRIVIADDHPLIVQGIERLFALEADIEVVATCLDGDEAIDAVRTHRPDIIVLDIRMPRRSGMEVIRSIEREQIPTRVILLTAAIQDDEVIEAMTLGVRGIVLKQMAPRLLVQSVRKVQAGGQWIENTSMSRAMDLMFRGSKPAAGGESLLTPREMQIVQLAARGRTNKEIGNALSISEGTIKAHLHAIYRKLGIASRVDLANYARDHDLI